MERIRQAVERGIGFNGSLSVQADRGLLEIQKLMTNHWQPGRDDDDWSGDEASLEGTWDQYDTMEASALEGESARLTGKLARQDIVLQSVHFQAPNSKPKPPQQLTTNYKPKQSPRNKTKPSRKAESLWRLTTKLEAGSEVSRVGPVRVQAAQMLKLMDREGEGQTC